MKQMMKLAGLLLVVGVMSGCQSVGGKPAAGTAPTEVGLQVKIGVSTKETVKAQFGDGNVYQFANGYEVWTYQKTTGIPRFVNYIPLVGLLTPSVEARTAEMAFLFSPDGVLRNIDLRGQYQ